MPSVDGEVSAEKILSELRGYYRWLVKFYPISVSVYYRLISQKSLFIWSDQMH